MNSINSVLIQRLKQLFGELAGEDLESSNPDVSFIELGFDSLLLTQVSASVKRAFKVKINFRQLLEECDSFQSLANFIEPQLDDDIRAQFEPVAEAKPADRIAEKEPEAPVSSQLSLPSANASDLQLIVNEQLRIMEKQIELLQRKGKSSQTTTPTGSLKETPTAKISDEPKPISNAQHGPYRQLDKKSEATGLTSQQQAHLDWFIPRYASKSLKSKDYTQRYRKNFADPRAVAGFKQYWKEIVYPIVVERSKGSKLWDIDGNEWVDVTMGFGVALLGHSPDFINEAVSRQLEKGVEIGPQSPIAGEVAELICEFTHMDRVTFCNTGSEAVMAALRICRTVTGRTKVALFAGAYHGTFDEVLVKGATLKGKPKTLPLAPGVTHSHISEVTVLEYGTPESLDWIRENADDLAAVLVETVQSRHPDLQPKEFLKEIRIITKDAETPLIFDEVITGFRCHPGGAQAYFGIEADLATYGKVVGGGMPFGFIAGKAELMDAFDGGYWKFGDDSFPTAGVTFFAGTFVRHPLAMAAAKAILIYLKEKGEGLQNSIAEKTKKTIDELNDYFSKHSIPIKLERFTSVWYPKFGDDIAQHSLFYFHLREKGLHIWEGRPCFLSSVHSDEDTEFIAEAFKASVAEMQLGGFIPGTSDQKYWDAAKDKMGEAAQLPAIGDVCVAAQKHGNRFPLAEGQQEMWLGAQISPESAGPHHTCNAMVLEGHMDVNTLFKAIRKVIDRHEGLRSVFSPDGSEIIVRPSLELEIPIIDLSSLKTDERASRISEIMDRESRQIFDLSNGPLISFKLVKESDELHRLIFAAQMIVCDGWSHYVVFEEMSSIYSACLKGEEARLQPAIPMREYALWQKGQEGSDEAAKCHGYWMNVFKNVPQNLDLPTKGPRPRMRSVEADRRSIVFDASFYDKIKGYASSQKSSSFAVLLTAYQVLLQRLSGQDDIVVGVPFSAQGSLGMDSLVGQCANTLPFRANIESDMTFDSLLRRTWESLLDGQEHSNYTFGKLIEHLDIEIDASRIPLVSVLFNIDPAMAKVGFDGLKHKFESGPRIYYQYDLGFNLVEDGQQLRVECDFNTKLFEGGVIDSWIHCYKRILEAVVSDQGGLVSTIPIGSSPSRADYSPKIEVEAKSKSLVDLFAEQVAKTPGTLASGFENQSISYEALDTRSNQIARTLIKAGIKKGSLVGICLERSIDMVAAILGILKTGAAYMPIDARFPIERKHYLIENSLASIVLTGTNQKGALTGIEPGLFCLEDEEAAISEEDNSRPEISISSEDLAYVIYTSGSTGQPKGVEIPHRAVANFLLSMRDRLAIKPSDRILALTSLSFDISILELYLPLISGASSYIVSRDTTLDPALIDEIIIEKNISLVQTTPSSWRMYLDAGWKGKKSLKLLSGGEAMSESLAEELQQTCSELWNVYGPTETTVWSTAGLVHDSRNISIGQPIANTQLYVLDKNGQPLPCGVPGELHIGGLGIAHGYRNQEKLTKEKFLASHLSESGKLYKTGDNVVIKSSDEIEYIGRIDHQIKVRGCLVEPVEIESVLRGHELVREAAVIQQKNSFFQEELIAYLKLKRDIGSQTDKKQLYKELRQLLKTSLPDYMIVDHFGVIDTIPQTSEGKLDRSQLPEPDRNILHSRSDIAEPKTETQQQLAEIWKDILKVNLVAIDESFFDLGGQSLMAVKLFNKIEEVFHKKLPLSTLFEFSTISQLGEILDQDHCKTNWPSLVKIKESADSTPLFLVHGAGGNILLYQALAERLPNNIGVYGLQSQGLDGSSKPLNSIEEMAERYLREIREVQPKGPYYLGGYCLGGTIAYEMAQRLRLAGEEVPVVLMLDTYNFSKALKVRAISFIIQKLKFHLSNLASVNPKNLISYLREKVRLGKDGEFANLLSSRPGATAEGVARASDGAEATVQAINDDAAEAYIPEPYNGPVILVKPKVNYKFYPDPKMGWGDLVKDLEILELPLNPHAMLVEPFVEILASHLSRLVAPEREREEITITEIPELADIQKI